MKILWFCNCPITDKADSSSGTWLSAMSNGLIASGQVNLCIIAQGVGNEFTRHDYGQIQQWIVPANLSLGCDGLPSQALINKIISVVREFSPDLVQVWGVESFWGLLSARGLIAYPSLLTVQGFKSAVSNVYLGSLTWIETFRCITIKDAIQGRTLWKNKRVFRNWGCFEREIIQGHRFVETQSPWSTGHIRANNSSAEIFDTAPPLRAQFEQAITWQPSECSVIFTSWAYPAPFKGMDIAIRALALLRQRIPLVRLRIAGPCPCPGLRQNGYIRWITNLIRSLKLEDAIDWLGPISAGQIVRELQKATLALVPSFVESYCMAMAEAMSIGTPVVSSFTGGTSYLGADEQSCLFFPPGDVLMCAYQMGRVLEDSELAIRISLNAQKEAMNRPNKEELVLRQLNTYRQVCGKAML